MKQWIKAHLGLWILALAAVLVAGVMLVPRMQAEQANMTYDIIVDYKDFQNLSQQSKYDISWWMHYLNDLGLEKVALFESTLDSHTRSSVFLWTFGIWRNCVRPPAGLQRSLRRLLRQYWPAAQTMMS